MPRQRVRFPKGWLHVLPAGDADLGVLGLKSYTSFKEGNRFLITLYSAENGQLLALVESNYLGMLRTGAMSGVATKYMARPDADAMAIIGTGLQACGQVLGVAAVRPLKRIHVYGIEKQQQFAEQVAGLTGVETQVEATAEAAVEASLIVSTATWSVDPVFKKEAVKPGTHINAVGSNALHRKELDEKLVGRASLVVVDVQGPGSPGEWRPARSDGAGLDGVGQPCGAERPAGGSSAGQEIRCGHHHLRVSWTGATGCGSGSQPLPQSKGGRCRRGGQALRLVSPAGQRNADAGVDLSRPIVGFD